MATNISAILNYALIGEIKLYSSNTIPDGWLVCDGSAVSRTTYASLFSVVGTTYGSGDGSTTFNLPDFKGRTAIGVGESSASGHTAHTLGQMAGEETHILTASELAKHYHTVRLWNYIGSGGYAQGAANYGANTANQSGGFKASYNTIQNGGWQSGTFNGIAQNGYGDHAGLADSAGNNGAHNTMQPYLCVNYIIYTGRKTN